MYDNKKQDSPNLFHGLEVWAEPAMAAEDLLINDRGDGQARGEMCKIFQIFCWNHFHIDACFTSLGAQLHKCTNAPTGRSWPEPDVVLSDFELLLDCSARACCTWKQDMPSELFAQYRSLKHHACSCTKSVSRCFSYVWSTTDMAHQENENLDQKLHLPKIQCLCRVSHLAQ